MVPTTDYANIVPKKEKNEEYANLTKHIQKSVLLLFHLTPLTITSATMMQAVPKTEQKVPFVLQKAVVRVTLSATQALFYLINTTKK